MAQYIRGEGRWLNRAAQQLQMKPSFRSVTYEEARGPPPRVLFSKWLHINPFFDDRSRWTAHSWASWGHANSTDIGRITARARQALRALAIQEQDYQLALERLRTSRPNERCLNEKLASLHRGEYLIQEGLLPVHLVFCEIQFVTSLLMGAPSYILNPLKELREQIVSDLGDLSYNIQALTKVLRVRLHSLLGANAAQHSALMHRLELPLQREEDKLHAMKRYARRIWKYARPDDLTTNAVQEEEIRSYTASDSSLPRDAIRATRNHVGIQQAQALNRYPTRWVSTIFTIHFEDIMIKRAAQVLTNAYWVTKLPLQDDMSHIGNESRNKASKRAKYILDRQQFLLPHPYGHNGIIDQDLYTAVRELNWIRSYRIEKFPESVSQDEIRLARRFHSRMRKQFVESSHRYAQTTTTTRREQKLRAKKLKIIEASLIPATALGSGKAGGGGGGQRGRVEMRPEPDAPALVMAFADFQREQALPLPLLRPKTTHMARFDIDQVFSRKGDIDTSQKRNVSPGRPQRIPKAMSTADSIVNAEGTTPTNAKSTREASTAQEVRPKRMAQEQGSKQRILQEHPDRRQINRGRKSRLTGAQSIGLPGDTRLEVK